MPVYSMTGYATAQQDVATPEVGGDAKSSATTRFGLEIRAVNSRFLDLSFRLPEELRQHEPALRELLTAKLKRGKVEVRAALDAETVSLVKQIYQQQFDKQHNAMSEERQQRVQFTVKDTTVTLENITTDANNANTGKAVCSAQLATVFPEDAVKAEPQMEQYMRAIYEKQGAVL